MADTRSSMEHALSRSLLHELNVRLWRSICQLCDSMLTSNHVAKGVFPSAQDLTCIVLGSETAGSLQLHLQLQRQGEPSTWRARLMLGLLQQRSQSLHQGLAEACNIYGYLKRTHASACSIALRVRSCTNVASTAEERRHLTTASSSGGKLFPCTRRGSSPLEPFVCETHAYLVP